MPRYLYTVLISTLADLPGNFNQPVERGQATLNGNGGEGDQ